MITIHTKNEWYWSGVNSIQAGMNSIQIGIDSIYYKNTILSFPRVAEPKH